MSRLVSCSLFRRGRCKTGEQPWFWPLRMHTWELRSTKRADGCVCCVTTLGGSGWPGWCPCVTLSGGWIVGCWGISAITQVRLSIKCVTWEMKDGDGFIQNSLWNILWNNHAPLSDTDTSFQTWNFLVSTRKVVYCWGNYDWGFCTSNQVTISNHRGTWKLHLNLNSQCEEQFCT